MSLQHDLVLYGDDFCDGGVGDLEELGKKLHGRKILLVEAIRQLAASQSRQYEVGGEPILPAERSP